MDCPYLDCKAQKLASGVERCSTCGRLVKTCRKCGVFSRAFANFCRSCGETLPESQAEWAGFKGGPQRRGLNPRRLGQRVRDLEAHEVLELKLGDACRSLLSWDQHLVAVAQGGTVEVADPATGEDPIRFAADGPITSHPCIERGVLYLARAGRISAYALGALTLKPPRKAPRWEARIQGTPVNALLAFKNRLYFNVVHQDGERSIQVLDGLDHQLSPESRIVYTARKLSSLASDGIQRVVFLSEEDGEIKVHELDHSQSDFPEVQSNRVPSPLLPLVDQVPIACMGAKVFAVFGDEDSLCRLDLDLGYSSTQMRQDAKRFSLNRFGEWVQVETAGLAFPHLQVRDELTPMERVRGEPVILRDSAAAIGMQDGRILVYDLPNPPYHLELRLTRSPREITALASFRGYLVAGDAAGTVKVFEFLPRSG